MNYKYWALGYKRGAESLRHECDIYEYVKNAEIFGKLTYLPFLYQVGARKSNILLKRKIIEFKPDLFLVSKGELIFPSTLNFIRKKLGIKSILWFPDDPQLFERISRYIAKYYDFVFTSSFKSVENYEKIGVDKVEYIPFCCDPTFHRNIELTKDDKRKFTADITFVGKFYPEREKVLKALLDYDLKIYGQNWQFSDKDVRSKWTGQAVFGEDLIKVYNASKIVLNIHDNEMKYGGMKSNIRSFEAMGCGAFVLSDKPDGIEDIFDIDKQIVCFKSKKQLLYFVDYYLENEKEREKIARRGQKRTYKDHTFYNRMKKVISVAENL